MFIVVHSLDIIYCMLYLLLRKNIFNKSLLKAFFDLAIVLYYENNKMFFLSILLFIDDITDSETGF